MNDMVTRRRAGALLTGGAMLGLMPARARAVGWPDHVVKLIVGAVAGGGGDIVARLIAAPLSARLGQPVIVENRPGAGGNIASAALAHARPDGYTLMLAYTGYAISPALFSNLSFDPIKDVKPISLIAYITTVLIVRTASPYKSVQDLVDAAKARPGELTVGYLEGSSTFLIGKRFMQRAGIKVTEIPYRANVEAMNALLGGQIDFSFDSLGSAGPQIEGGLLRALAVTDAQRSSSLPGVPTLARQALVATWSGPAGTA